MMTSDVACIEGLIRAHNYGEKIGNWGQIPIISRKSRASAFRRAAV